MPGSASPSVDCCWHALLAAMVLGDRLGPVGILGAVLLATAVLLAMRAPADPR